MAEQLSLPHLKGFAARLHLAVHVRSQPLSREDQTLVTGLLCDADNLWRNQGHGLADAFAFLAERVDDLIEDFSVGADTPLGRSLNRLRETFDALSRDKRLCDAGKPGAAGGIAGGIQPVFDLCVSITDWVQAKVARFQIAVERPQITLATTHRGWGHDQRIIQKFSLSGWADVAQALNACTVGLDIRECAFDWPQYCLLPYVLLHEILCHGFQSLDGGRPRRNADYNCGWSEGWMDRLAFRLAKEWIAEEGQRFNLVSPDHQECAIGQTLALHDARYEFEDPPAHCTFGRGVFDVVQQSYGAPITQTKMSAQPVTRFSLRFNTMTVPAKERRFVLERFDTLVRSGRAEQVHFACGAFNARGDLARLKAALAA